MSVSPDYAPKLPAIYIREEHAFFVEASFEAVFYGITVTLYILTLHTLSSKGRLKQSWKLATFMSVQNIATLIGVAGNIDLIARSFVYNRNIPGGPVAYQQRYSTLPFSFAALAGFTISVWLQDGMLLYRALTIWNTKHRTLFLLPLLLYIASIAFSLILLIQVGHPAAFRILTHLPIPLIFFSLSVTFNALLAALIASRLLHHRRALAGSVGSARAVNFISGIGVVIESAALYSVVGIAQLVSFRLDPAVATGIEGLYGVMAALSTHLIAYRMSTGHAWTQSTMHEAALRQAHAEDTDLDLERTALLSSRGADDVGVEMPIMQERGKVKEYGE